MKRKGFTLVELIVAMAIIAILIVLGIAGFSVARRAARNTQRRDIAAEIHLYAQDFETKHKNTPTDAEIDDSSGTLTLTRGSTSEEYELSDWSGFDDAEEVSNGSCPSKLAKNQVRFIFTTDAIGVCMEPDGYHMAVGEYAAKGID